MAPTGRNLTQTSCAPERTTMVLLDCEYGSGLGLRAADGQDDGLVSAGGGVREGDVDLVEAGRCQDG